MIVSTMPESSPAPGGRRADRGRQLFRRQLSAVLGLDARGRRSTTPCPRCRRAARARHAARPLPAHPVLPEALPLLLFPGLHRQERRGGQQLPRPARARVGALRASCRAIAGRKLDFVYFGGGTPSFLSTTQLGGLVKRLTALTPWSIGRRDHLRVRAGDADRSEARRDPRDGRDAPQPRRRELRRSRFSR